MLGTIPAWAELIGLGRQEKSRQDGTMQRTPMLVLKSLAVIALAAAAAASLAALRDWLGDWAALLWTCAVMFFPWVAGLAAGRLLAAPTQAKLAGAVIGVVVVLAPLYAFAAAPLREIPASVYWTLAGPFAALGAVLGATALPVGVRLRAAVSKR